jgi:MFS family permease
MLGAYFTPWLSRRVGSARLIWVSLAVTTPLTLAVPLARPGWSVWLVVAGAAAGELGQIVYAIANVSLRQRLVPDHLLGRVNATLRVLIMGLLPLGAVFGGVLGALAGTRATLLAAASIALVGPVVLRQALRGVREVEQVVFASSTAGRR